MLAIFDAVLIGYCRHAPHGMRKLFASQLLLYLTKSSLEASLQPFFLPGLKRWGFQKGIL
jgi:hypothetical protein